MIQVRVQPETKSAHSPGYEFISRITYSQAAITLLRRPNLSGHGSRTHRPDGCRLRGHQSHRLRQHAETTARSGVHTDHRRCVLKKRVPGTGVHTLFMVFPPEFDVCAHIAVYCTVLSKVFHAGRASRTKWPLCQYPYRLKQAGLPCYERVNSIALWPSLYMDCTRKLNPANFVVQQPVLADASSGEEVHLRRLPLIRPLAAALSLFAVSAMA